MLYVVINGRIILRLGIAIEVTEVKEIPVANSGFVFIMLASYDMAKPRLKVSKSERAPVSLLNEVEL